MTAAQKVAADLRALVAEIKGERGETEEYLIVDDVLARLPRMADELDATATGSRAPGSEPCR